MTGLQQAPDRELEAALCSWLDEGVTSLSDRVVDSLIRELPSSPQRRRSWLVLPGRPLLAMAATMVLVLALSVAVWLGNVVEPVEPTPSWRAMRYVEAPLEPGHYLLGSPFPIHVGMTLPEGWGGNPGRETYAQVNYIGGGEGGGTALFFTFVEGVYRDPCHLEQGFIDPPVGPGVDDLAAALAVLPGVSVSGPSDTVLGGRPAVTLALIAPSAFEGCTGQTDGPPFRLWGVPEWGAMAPGERLRLWIVAVGGERLVIGAEEFADSSPEALAALNTVVASLRLEPEEPVASASLLPNEFCNPCTPLPPSGPLLEGRYAVLLRLHRYVGDTRIPLEQRHRVTFDAQPGWSSTGAGIVTSDAPLGGGARLAIWNVARIYLDPCHWQTSAYGTVNGSALGQLDSLADSFWKWWAPEAVVGDEYVPPARAPDAAPPIDETRSGYFAKRLVLTLPRDLDLAACDGGEYRIWEDLEGRARSASGPGERISLWVVDLAPGLLVIDASTMPDTSEQDRRLLTAMLPTVWVERPADFAGQ